MQEQASEGLQAAAKPDDQSEVAGRAKAGGKAPAQAALMPFDARGELPWAIPFGWQEYAQLMGWTGRLVQPGRHGHIEDPQPAILQRPGLEAEAFADMACHLLERFGVAVRAPSAMARLCARTQRRFLYGQRVARRVFQKKFQKIDKS